MLVPLCGKAIDMAFIADMGHEVVGVEGVRQAIDEFAAENPQYRMALRPPPPGAGAGADAADRGASPSSSGGAEGPAADADPAFATFAAETAALEIVQGKF